MARKRLALALLAAAAALTLTACSSEPEPAPDLKGHWIQPNSDSSTWYHIATITDNKIMIWWYLSSQNDTNLYWSGSFTPPEDGKEPYTWQSTNDHSEEYLDLLFKYRRTSREPVKTFTYQDGRISYQVTSGHLVMNFELEKTDDPNVPAGETFVNSGVYIPEGELPPAGGEDVPAAAGGDDGGPSGPVG